MTPDLIAKLLEETLPVRLTLLDADPNGAGWYVRPLGATLMNSAHSFPFVIDDIRRYVTEHGAAWLPCNPLAIVEHAGTFKLPDGTSNVRAGVANDGLAGKYAAWVIYYDPTGAKIGGRDSGAHDCPHTAALALLREVVG